MGSYTVCTWLKSAYIVYKIYLQDKKNNDQICHGFWNIQGRLVNIVSLWLAEQLSKQWEIMKEIVLTFDFLVKIKTWNLSKQGYVSQACQCYEGKR